MKNNCVMCGTEMEIKNFDYDIKQKSKILTTVNAEGYVCKNIVCGHKSFSYEEATRLLNIKKEYM